MLLNFSLPLTKLKLIKCYFHSFQFNLRFFCICCAAKIFKYFINLRTQCVIIADRRSSSWVCISPYLCLSFAHASVQCACVGEYLPVFVCTCAHRCVCVCVVLCFAVRLQVSFVFSCCTNNPCDIRSRFDILIVVKGEKVTLAVFSTSKLYFFPLSFHHSVAISLCDLVENNKIMFKSLGAFPLYLLFVCVHWYGSKGNFS